MEGFYAGIIIRIGLTRITPLDTLCGLDIGLGNKLAASVTMDNLWLARPYSQGFLYRRYHGCDRKGAGERPSNDLTRK